MMSASDRCVRLSIRRNLSFGADEVFRAICDHERLPAWLLPGARVVTEISREGVTIREIRKWFFVGREEILSCDPSGKLEYRIVSGLPVRHHHAQVSVVPAGDGCSLLTWEVEYDSGYEFLNSLVARSIRKTLEDGLNRLPDYLDSLDPYSARREPKLSNADVPEGRRRREAMFTRDQSRDDRY